MHNPNRKENIKASPASTNYELSLYGGVEDSLNVRVEYQAADQILSFYVALESLSSS